MKVLRSDGGGEYISLQFQFLMDEGITQQKTAAYKPQQNGVAERFNRTLIEMARTTLIHAKLGNTEHHDVIEVNQCFGPLQAGEDTFHCSLKCFRCVDETKWHAGELK